MSLVPAHQLSEVGTEVGIGPYLAAAIAISVGLALMCVCCTGGSQVTQEQVTLPSGAKVTLRHGNGSNRRRA